MANMFTNLKTADKDSDKDYTGYQPLKTNLYDMEIKAAYLTKAAFSESQAVNLVCHDKDGKEFKTTVYVLYADGQAARKDEKTGKLKNIRGYNSINSLCLLAIGQDLSEVNIEKRQVKIYDWDAWDNVVKSMPCLIDLHGKTVTMAIKHSVVDKRAKGADGAYQPTGETKEENEVEKFMVQGSNATLSEVTAHFESLDMTLDDARNSEDYFKTISELTVEDGVSWAAAWQKKNKGVLFNRAKGTGFSANTAGSSAKTSDPVKLF